MPHFIYQPSGGALSARDLKGLLGASYDAKQTQVGDFTLDKSLSTNTSKVYYNPKSGQTIVAHKGTEGFADWGNNLAYLLGGEWGYKKTDRYKEAKAVQKAAERKYGTENLSTIGHSQGGLQAELLGGKSKEIITLNKAAHPLIKRTQGNQFDVRSSNDVVSAFSAPSKNQTTIDATTRNPLTEHSGDILDRLEPETQIGKGISPNTEYKIKPYSYQKAQQLGVEIAVSKRKGKKIDVYRDGKKVASIGALSYDDYPTFMEKEGRRFADERRERYRSRHRKEANKVGTAGYYAYHILW